MPNTTVRAAAEGLPQNTPTMNRRAVLGGIATVPASAGATLAFGTGDVSTKHPGGPASTPGAISGDLAALIEAHRAAQAVVDANTGGLRKDDHPDLDEMLEREWNSYHDVNGYAPRTIEEARVKLDYLLSCPGTQYVDEREFFQLARSFVVEPGTIVEFDVRYRSEKEHSADV